MTLPGNESLEFLRVKRLASGEVKLSRATLFMISLVLLLLMPAFLLRLPLTLSCNYRGQLSRKLWFTPLVSRNMIPWFTYLFRAKQITGNEESEIINYRCGRQRRREGKERNSKGTGTAPEINSKILPELEKKFSFSLLAPKPTDNDEEADDKRLWMRRKLS